MTDTRPAAVAAPARARYRAFAVEVRRVRRLSPSFVRVTLAGDDLVHFHPAGDDLRIKLVLPLPGTGLGSFPRDDDWYGGWRMQPADARCPIRTYTARALRPEAGELDVDFVVHGDSGPATRWVNRAAVGDPLLVVGPDTRAVEGDGPIAGVEFRPGDAHRLLLAGDETAVPAVCSILEGLPRTALGQAFLEVPTADDVLDVDAPAGVAVTWLPRDARPEAPHGDALDRAVRAWASEMVAGADAPARDDSEIAPVDPDDILWDVPDPRAADRPLYAWIAGEASCVTGLRRHLVRERGVDRRDVAFMGYWRHGRAEC